MVLRRAALSLRVSVLQQPCRWIAIATNAFAFHVLAMPRRIRMERFGSLQTCTSNDARTVVVRRRPEMHKEVANTFAEPKRPAISGVFALPACASRDRGLFPVPPHISGGTITLS
jgi:hypothetical protein